jgi:twitching motility protein PilT
MSLIRELLAKAVERDASDVHLKPGQKPHFRVGGELEGFGSETLGEEDLRAIVADLLPPYLRESYQRTHEADFSHEEPGSGRYRVNVFNAQGAPSLAMRHVKSRIPTVQELRLPPRIRDLAGVRRGIVILAGTTGSGKSTTLAAVIGEINRTLRRRVITVEDPVEYLFQDEMSLITQREVGLDTLSFESALKYVLREDPDVILIGEMRDRVSIRTSLLAAETGHLVLSTLHAGTASQAVPRMLDVFSAEEQDQIRMAIASTLHAVVCQRLLRDVEQRLVPAVELLFNTPTVRKLLERNELERLGAAIDTGGEDGMQSFNQALYHLIRSGTVTETQGMRFATNPESLRMNLQGIFLDEGRRILGGT